MPAWVLGLVSGLAITGLSFAGMISIDACLASLISLAVCTLFPIPWTQAQEKFQELFQARKQPLEEKREFAAEQLAKISKEVQVSEQRGRETDALYHAGREISKLLSLQDTLEFSKEIIRDTLIGSGGAGGAASERSASHEEPCFVLMLVDEEAGVFRLGASSGLEAELAARFETSLGGLDLMSWLRRPSQALDRAQYCRRTAPEGNCPASPSQGPLLSAALDPVPGDRAGRGL